MDAEKPKQPAAHPAEAYLGAAAADFADAPNERGTRSLERVVSFRCLRCGAAANEAASPDLSPRTVRVDMSQCPKCELGDYYQESQYDAEGKELSIEEIVQFHTAWLREGEAAKANH